MDGVGGHDLGHRDRCQCAHRRVPCPSRGGPQRYCGGVADMETGLATCGVLLPGTATVAVRPSFSAKVNALAMSLMGPAGTPTEVRMSYQWAAPCLANSGSRRALRSSRWGARSAVVGERGPSGGGAGPW